MSMHKEYNWLKVSTFKLLAAFIGLDLIALLLHYLYSIEILDSRFFNVSRDRGFGELISYLKYIIVISIFWSWTKYNPSRIVRSWLVFFIVLLLDDAIGLHEFIGKLIIQKFEFFSIENMRTKDIAELFGFALLEGVALLAVALDFFRDNAGLKVYSFWLGLFLLPLIFSGSVLDNFAVPLLEQIGEMLGATLVLAYVHRDWQARNLCMSKGTSGNNL